MPDERVLDFHRRHPDPTHLQHVVAPAAVPEIAVGVLVVLVACLDIVAEQRPPRLLLLVPVVRHDRVALDPEIADLPGRHRASVIVDDQGLVARHGQPCRARSHLPRTIRQEDVQDLRGPDAVQRLDAEGVPPATVEILRQRLSRGDAEAERREVVALRRLFDLQHGGIERRDAEEERGPVAVDQLEHGFGERSMRIEHALPAHAHGEVQVIAEPVREEELGRRDRAVRLGHPEHPARVGLGAEDHVVLEVHGALGPARRARRIEPERGLVPGRIGRLES